MTTCTPRLGRMLITLLLAAAGCSGGPTTPADAGGDTPGAMDVVGADHAGGDGAAVCTADAQCDNGTYCDGTERCAPGTAGADARGCVHGTAPCTASQNCVEATRSCIAMMCTHPGMPDMDSDGHPDIACGGDDCDDGDAHRFPGNPEVCLFGTASDGTLTRTGAATVMGVAMTLDPTHDEDCNPVSFASATTHDGDHDGDGFVDSACSNTDLSGMLNRGADCADLNPVAAMPASLMASVQPGNIHPMQVELCNGVDDNCDGHVDEGDPGGGGMCANPLNQVCAMGANHCVMGSLSCVAPETAPLMCCAGAADCDSNTATGCETNTSNDVHNCGRCHNACPAAVGGGATCISGACGQTCTSPQVSCSGTCQDLTAACNNGLPGYCQVSGHLACSGSSATCVAGGPARFPGATWRGDSAALSHGIGSRDVDGMAWAVASYFTPATGYLQFGPYIDLPMGNYTVTFNVTVSAPSAPAGSYPLVVTFDASADHGATELRSVSMGLHADPGENQAIPVAFTVSTPCAQNVELRVFVNSYTSNPVYFEIASTVLSES